jgi:hypothetical protein
MKKNLLSLVAISLLSSSLYAANGTPIKVNTDLEYDIGKGWWWYEETYKDPETNEEKKVKYSLTPKEKAELDEKKKTNELLKEMVSEQKENKKINQAILDRLNYAFPNVTPIYSTNKKTGEQCLTNSSMDCFVMPVIAEGQQIPALKEFLREPSPSNSKNWLQWQATYFNHVQKVSHGLRFAYLKHGSDAYPTATTFAKGDSLAMSQAESVQAHREAKIIHSLKDKIALLNFVGKNSLYEKSNKVNRQIHNWNKSFLKDIDKVFIFDSEKSRDIFLAEAEEEATRKGDKDILEFWKTAKVTVRPDLYKTYQIQMTPSTVVFYEDKTKKVNINQTIVSGTLSSEAIRKQLTNFLTYNSIIDPKEYSADTNWESPEMNYNTSIPKPNDTEIYKDYISEDKSK